MRLSEAIRLGAMMRPKAESSFYDPDTTGSCALGAALDACGQLNTSDPVHPDQNIYLYRTWPFLHDVIECPVRAGKRDARWRLIWDLNDSYGWTREQIADWIETAEQQQERRVDQPAEAFVA